jgi:hypothetical protein
MKNQDKPKVQKTGNMISRMNDFKNIHTGSAKTHPGVLKAKADKAKRDSILAEYKKKTVTKVVAKPASKMMPAKVTVNTTKAVINPKTKMVTKPTPNRMDYFRKKADSLSESGFKKSIDRNFIGMDKDFSQAKKMQSNAFSELKKAKKK